MKNTETKIMQAAETLFSQYGFKAVTTREIAKKAGVNLCALNYHFGTKKALYERVLLSASEFIAEKMREKKNAESDSDARTVFKKTLCDFFDLMTENEKEAVKFGLIIREVLFPSDSYDLFYKTVFEPMHKRLCALAAESENVSPDNEQIVVLVHSLLGQIVMFKLHKKGLCSRLGVSDYSAELKSEIKERLIKNCDAVLKAGL